MVIFEVKAMKVADPRNPGRMLDRGSRLLLEPEIYESHARLSARLRPPSWAVVEPKEPEPAVEPAKSDGLLPHQREVLRRLDRG